MQACVAAGGSGSRLRPATKWLNKHMLPVAHNTLMIDYPLSMIRSLGFDTVSVVTGCEHAGQISEHVQDGERYGFRRVNYIIQSKPDGIGGVVQRVAHLVDDEGLLLILGDNYFSDHMQLDIRSIDHSRAIVFEYDLGAKERACAFGQITRDRFDAPFDIVEKPDMPEHSRIVTGMYYFPRDVVNYVADMTPSKRNELEITDLIKVYLQQQRLVVSQVEGHWNDLGEWPSLRRHIAEVGQP